LTRLVLGAVMFSVAAQSRNRMTTPIQMSYQRNIFLPKCGFYPAFFTVYYYYNLLNSLLLLLEPLLFTNLNICVRFRGEIGEFPVFLSGRIQPIGGKQFNHAIFRRSIFLGVTFGSFLGVGWTKNSMVQIYSSNSLTVGLPPVIFY
jgi:hypothetical protein